MNKIKGKIIEILLNSSLVKSKTIIQIGRIIQSIRPTKYVEIEGRKMFCHGNDGLALSIFKTYEPSQTQIVKKYVKEGDVVVDIGAHVGYYTFLLSQLVGSKGKVYAFEPDLQSFELLKKGIEINNYKNIEVIQKAVSNKNEIVRLYLGNEDRATNRIYDAKLNDTKDSIEVETIKLDEYFRDKKIDFVKIDAEGSEQGIIEGMSSIIKNNHEIKIMTEFFPFLMEKYGSNPKKILEILEKSDFKIYHISNNEITRIKIKEYLERITVKNKNCTNLLCLK